MQLLFLLDKSLKGTDLIWWILLALSFSTHLVVLRLLFLKCHRGHTVQDNEVGNSKALKWIPPPTFSTCSLEDNSLYFYNAAFKNNM